MKLEKLISFSRLLNQFALVERMITMPGTERYENDAEHSFHLALMAWYLVETEKLDLDLSKVLRYSLVHDLVELYAGDTYLWTKDTALLETKEVREAAAAARLREELPEFPDLHDAIDAYETRRNREARFVYALDKICPMIMIEEDGGRHWRRENVTIDAILEKKVSKVALSPEVEPYFNELVALIEQRGSTAEFAQAREL